MPHRIFDNLPSVSELLEKPPLKKLTETVNSNSIVTGVRSYMDRYQRELQARAADYRMPPVGDLAETISRWISGVEAGQATAVINASGNLFSQQISSAPLSAAALEAVFGRCRDFQACLPVNSATADAQQEAVALIKKLTQADAAMVCGTRRAALQLALASLPLGSKVVVARGQLGETFDGIRVPELITSLGLELLEVGTTNNTSLDEYQEAVDDQVSALLVFDHSNFSGVERTSLPELSELATLAKNKNVTLVLDLGLGSLVEQPAFESFEIATADKAIAAGVSLIVASAGHLLGGPEGGLLLGESSKLTDCQNNAWAAAAAANNLTLVSLAATLEIYLTSALLEDEIAVLSLLSTSVENLNHRGERLAQLLEASELVASATCVEATASLFEKQTQIPSVAIEIAVAEDKLEELKTKLSGSAYPVVFQEIEGKILINLRYVFPRQDLAIAEAFD